MDSAITYKHTLMNLIEKGLWISISFGYYSTDDFILCINVSLNVTESIVATCNKHRPLCTLTDLIEKCWLLEAGLFLLYWMMGVFGA